jgi:phosphoribosyl 1,2-cyclic phosphate phosphodiesterase
MNAPAERITATILGCGSSAGVPRIGNDWGACDPSNPKNRRRRCSLLIEGVSPSGVTRILIDTGCDLREQLLDAGVSSVDAVLYTHAHADHIHGIDDLRVLALMLQRRVPVYYDAETGIRLHEAFGYCFETPPGSTYPPILAGHVIEAGQELTIDGEGGALTVTPFNQVHGDIFSFGYRIGNVAYSCDLNDLEPDALPFVSDLDVWIVDALRYRPHPSHFSVDDALRWIERQAPRQAVLTNLHVDLDYEKLDRDTPAHVVPAFDGMKIDVTTGRILPDGGKGQ